MENILFSLYYLRRLRPLIINLARRFDGGSLELVLLRRIFKEYHNIDVGAYSYGGCFNAKYVASGIQIGKFCSFADHIYIYAANHKLSAVTTHPFIYNPSLGVINEDLREYNHVQIGNDVWMGQHAMIMPSTSNIGDGAVIAAGAVVTKDVPSYAVVAGVPARIIKYRFSEDIVRNLLEIKWWDWETEKIFSFHNAFNSVDRFLELANRI